MTLTISISTGSREPIYKQVIGQIVVAIARGALKPGDELPSVRALAERLVVNPNTIMRAYSELQRERLIESRPGRGYFVLKPRTVLSEHERERVLKETLDHLMREALLMGYSRKEVVDKLNAYWKEQINE